MFTGRAKDLLKLADAFLYETSGQDVVVTHTTVAAGMGGIGKTQLVVEFSHRYGRFFPGGVFWLSFAQPDNIPSEIAACGGPAGLDLAPGFEGLPLADQVQLVQKAWRLPVARLLIFDNCEEEGLLAQWRPEHGGCHVLATSRRSQWDGALAVNCLPLDVLPRDESVTLLRRLAPELHKTDAAALAAELGDLPLALHLAGSFLANYGRVVTPADYLRQLQDKRILDHASMMGRGTSHSPTNHDLDVARTFTFSYERLDLDDETDALALMLLARVAYLAPGEPVPDDLRQALAPEDIEAGEEARLQVEDAWQRLLALGFLETEQNNAVRLHRLLALFVQQLRSAGEAEQAAAEAAVLTVLWQRADQAGYIGPLPLLLPHLRFVTAAAQEREDIQAANLCGWLGYYLKQIASYAAARPYYERALAIQEEALGPSHPHTATSLNNLGYLLKEMGQTEAARPYYERALAIQEEALGPDHPHTATGLNDLGGLLRAMGQHEAARPYYERALAIYAEILGPDHPHTATSLNNFGALLQEMGQTEAARPYYERALAIREEALGPDHPDTAGSLNNLANLSYYEGDKAEAARLMKRALVIWEASLGPDHPNSKRSRESLAVIASELGE